MASFTDQIPQFNPYVQQLPVDAMVKVGVQKQQQYQQGIQKIQENIDKIAGLPVLRDVDKAYLQSKVNQLGNNLRPFMASDFSDFQLQNSVAGMTTAIADDPNIQTAVNSTAFYAKQKELMDKARAEGKSSSQNEWAFNESVSSYLQSSDLQQRFTGMYKPYVDQHKKAMEVIKALHPSLSNVEIPYEIGPDGKINVGKIAAVIKAHKIEGITAEKIKQAVSSSLTPDDMAQLDIDGRYQFRNYGPEHLIVKAKNDYQQDKTQAINAIAKLEEAKKISSDPTQTDIINQQLNYYKKLVGSADAPGVLDINLQKNIEQATNNPETVKFNMYKTAFIDQLSNAFSWKTEEVTWKDSPIQKQLNFIAEMRHKQQVENRARYEFGVNTGLKLKELELRAEANRIAAAKAAAETGPTSPGNWVEDGSPTEANLTSEQKYQLYLDGIEGSIKSDMATLEKKYTKDQIATMLEDWKQAGGIPSAATKVKPGDIAAISNIAKNQNYLETAITLQANLRKQAEQEINVAGTVEEQLKGKNNIRVTNSRGQTITITPKEAFNIANAHRNSAGLYGTPLGVVSPEVMRTLSTNERNFLEVITQDNSYMGKSIGKRSSLSPEVSGKLMNILKPYFDISAGAQKKIDEIDVKYNELLGEFTPQFTPQSRTVGTQKNGAPTPQVMTAVTDLMNAARSNGVAANEDYNYETINKFLAVENNKDTSISIRRSGDDYSVVIRNKKFPDIEPQVLTLSADQVAANFGEEFVDRNSDAALRLQAGQGSTDLTGNPEQAHFQKQFGDMPNIRKYKVNADLIGNSSTPGLFSYRFYIKNNYGDYSVFDMAGASRTQFVGYEQGKAALSKIDDDTLITMLKTVYPDFDFNALEYKK